jgi:hypothetical protein
MYLFVCAKDGIRGMGYASQGSTSELHPRRVWHFYQLFYFIVVLKIEPEGLCMLSKHQTDGMHPKFDVFRFHMSVSSCAIRLSVSGSLA